MNSIFNRRIGGLLCSDVLAALSDYLDQELPPALRAQVDEHLSACDNCARFGGEIAGMLAQLRPAVPPIPADVAHRLQKRIEQWWA